MPGMMNPQSPSTPRGKPGPLDALKAAIADEESRSESERSGIDGTSFGLGRESGFKEGWAEGRAALATEIEMLATPTAPDERMDAGTCDCQPGEQEPDIQVLQVAAPAGMTAEQVGDAASAVWFGRDQSQVTITLRDGELMYRLLRACRRALPTLESVADSALFGNELAAHSQNLTRRIRECARIGLESD